MANNEFLDTRKLMTGKDGQLYITLEDGAQLFLAECDTFSAQLSVSNTDYQPVGSFQTFAVPVSYSVTLTLTEAVIRDDVMLTALYAALKEGYLPIFEFAGKLKNRQGKVNRQVFRECIPDGSVDLMNITPGDIVKRSWSFRVNATPELQEFFAS